MTALATRRAPTRTTTRRRRGSDAPGLFGVRTWKRSRLVAAVVFGSVSVFPLLYMVSLSFQPTSDILTSKPVLIPSHPTFLNYVNAWSENSFGRYFLNSTIVALATVVITVALASMAAFAFARYQFRFKELIFYTFLAALAVPSVELIIPQYLLVLKLHLTDSLLGLILIYASENLPFAIFLLRGFFEAVPKELEESFRLDGAGTMRVLTRLIAPLSVPALAVVAMFTFNFAWEEFVIALTLINSPEHRTLPIALNFFIGEHTTQWGPLFAASVIATIPSLIVFLISQRSFQRGVSLGGIR
ncbi:MAG: carbohydrate ABC transporter permease [Minisyncoccia bacterium]